MNIVQLLIMNLNKNHRVYDLLINVYLYQNILSTIRLVITTLAHFMCDFSIQL
ncbi:hypothetical protein Hdeb2414_s0019g00542251 [Helianthus debilis subsp. tardiflorus]